MIPFSILSASAFAAVVCIDTKQKNKKIKSITKEDI